MIVAIKPVPRAIGIGVAAAGLLIGSFLLGSGRSGAAASGTAKPGGSGSVVLTASAAGGKITVTGTGTVTGTPDQLVLSMGVQTSASSVSTALRQANEAATRVIHSLKAAGVRGSDIQTSGLSIQPNYSRQQPGSDRLRSQRATQRHAPSPGQGRQPDPGGRDRGGNATTVDGVSLNLTDTSTLLANARAAAIRDAQAKASQFARASATSSAP